MNRMRKNICVTKCSQIPTPHLLQELLNRAAYGRINGKTIEYIINYNENRQAFVRVESKGENQ